MKRLLPIFILIVSIIGILAPIAWNYYIGKKTLEVRIMSIISLLERDPILDELKIFYKGRTITNLTKMQFTVINTGRQPISEEEVKAFPTINFGPEREVLVTKIIRSDPPNVRCIIAESPNKITLRFSLLNPADFVEFSVYFEGSVEKSPTVDARIKGIKQIDVFDKTIEPIRPRLRLGWGTYVVGFFTFILSALFPFARKDRRVQIRTRKFLADNPHLLEQMTESSEFEGFIGKNLAFLPPDRNKKLRLILDDSTKGFPERKAMLVSQITEHVERVGGAELFYYISIGFIPLGIFYILWQIVF